MGTPAHMMFILVSWLVGLEAAGHPSQDHQRTKEATPEREDMASNRNEGLGATCAFVESPAR